MKTFITIHTVPAGMETPTESEIKEAVFEDKNLPIEEKEPEGENPWRIADNVVLSSNSYDVILITDSSDSDGLGCATLFNHKYGSDVGIIPASHRNWGYSPVDALHNVALEIQEGTPIYITDLGQNNENKEEWIESVSEIAKTNPIRFRDHHQTDKEIIEGLDAIDNVEYKHNTDVCATKIVLENDYPNAPDYLKEFAEYTNVRDLFKTDDPRFQETEILSNAAFWFPFMDYVELATEYGINLTEADITLDSGISYGEYIEARSYIKEQKLRVALNTVQFKDIEGYKFAFIYGQCYQSEAGRRLIEEQGADVAVIVKPSGNISIRSSDETELALPLAEHFDGGGHDCAAGVGDAFNEIDMRKENPISHVITSFKGAISRISTS